MDERLRERPAHLRRIIAMTAVAVAVAGLAACSSSKASSSTSGGPTTSGNPIKIGVPTALSGTSAQGGTDMVNTAKLAADEVNASGGVLGRKISIVPEDDACDAQTGVQAAQKIVTQGVAMVVGGYCSGVSLAEEPVFKQANIPFLLSISSSQKLTQQSNDNVFRVIFDDGQLAPVEASYISTGLKATRVAILSDDSTFGTGYAAGAKAALAKYPQVKIVYSDKITAGQSDYTSTLVNIGQAKPDLLLFAGYYPEMAVIARERTQLGQTYHLMADDGIADPALIKVGGSAVEGIDFVTAILSSFATNADAKTFSTNFQTTYGVAPSSYTIYEYDAMQVAFAALKAAGSTTPTALLTALRKTAYDGITGHIAFDATGDRTDVPAIVAVVKGGQFVPESSLVGSKWTPIAGS